MEKLIKRKQIFYTCKSSGKCYKWGEVKALLDKAKIELKDDDELLIYFEEAYDHGDSARDDHDAIAVHRYVEETDEELAERIRKSEIRKEEYRKKRWEEYLKLKREFEPDTIKINPMDPYGEEDWDEMPRKNIKEEKTLEQLINDLF